MVPIADLSTLYEHKPTDQPPPPTTAQAAIAQEAVSSGPPQGDVASVQTEHKELFIAPEFQSPCWEEPQSPPLIGQWKLDNQTTMHPFWGLRRLRPSELASENAAILKNQEKRKREEKG